MNPTPGSQHVDKLLTDVSIAYVQDQKDFIADKVFPILGVKKQSDLYATYSKADFMRIEVQERGRGVESAGGGYSLDLTASYYARKYALHKMVTDDDRENADDPISPERDASEYLAQQFRMKLDKLFVQNFIKTGVWTGASGGTDLTGVAGAPAANQFKQWDVAGSTPIADVKAQKIAIKKNTGFEPQVLVIGAEVFVHLEEHADFKDVIKYTERGILTRELVAAVLGVEEVVVAGSVENTAKEGATASMSFIHGKSALLVYRQKSPSLMKPSGGYIYAWEGLGGAKVGAPEISRIDMPWLGKGATRIEGNMAVDPKLVSADCGAYFTAAVG